MKVKIASTLGAVIAAFFAVLCCVGPLVFAALGVGAGAVGLLAETADIAKALIPYRPFFIGLTFLLLGIGFFSVYRKGNTCAADSSCPAPSITRTKVVLWVATGIAILLLLMPYLLEIGD